MMYAVLKLKEELADQLEVKKSFEDKAPKTDAIEKVLSITNRRIKELEEALIVLQPITC